MAAKVYFPGLNSLRFFAAFAVIITHVELMKKLLGFSSSWRAVEPVAFTPLQAIIQDEKYIFINPIIIGIPVLMYLCPFVIQDGVDLANTLCFLIILNVSTNKSSLLNLQNNSFDYLGMIYYGIYMYHLLVIVALLNFMKMMFDSNGELGMGQNTFVYLAAIVLAAVVTSLSYRYLETPFIRLKKKFTMIKSGEAAKES